ncbi:unnamed protein product [Miscanthus lutarioriparius]|uniref:Plastid lipid-associated protein/fibrillin conserved domain-containing protein n=1 Tax=Miscanthus lutarioriparius TaxID=422564 RepID=A0A811NK08_9POAL|nr:unnamed protein product [Miscanthus lutarioriparius]
MQEVESAVQALEALGGVPDPRKACLLRLIVSLLTSSSLIEGSWQLIFTTRPGTASPIQRTFVGVDSFRIFQEVYLRTDDPRVVNVVRFSESVGDLKVESRYRTRPRKWEARIGYRPHLDGEVGVGLPAAATPRGAIPALARDGPHPARLRPAGQPAIRPFVGRPASQPAAGPSQAERQGLRGWFVGQHLGVLGHHRPQQLAEALGLHADAQELRLERRRSAADGAPVARPVHQSPSPPPQERGYDRSEAGGTGSDPCGDGSSSTPGSHTSSSVAGTTGASSVARFGGRGGSRSMVVGTGSSLRGHGFFSSPVISTAMGVERSLGKERVGKGKEKAREAALLSGTAGRRHHFVGEQWWQPRGLAGGGECGGGGFDMGL